MQSFSAAWMADGYDYNSCNLVATNLAKAFDEDLTNITLSNTLTLLLRAFGAIIFGLLSDLFGRKWILTIDLLILAVLQIGTAFASTFHAFIGVRAVFGIAMGGIYGPAAALAMENMPTKARGLFSGLLQNGYAMGYILAAVMNIVAVPATDQGYKIIFYIGAGFSTLIAVIVALVPESVLFSKESLQTTELVLEGEDWNTAPTGTLAFKKRLQLFFRDTRLAATQNWRMFLYCVLFTSSYNWMTHACQDIYPSYVKVEKGFTSRQASIATIIGQAGAVIGGTTAGYYSQFLGRRLTSISCILIAWCFVPLFTLPNGFSSIVAGTFIVLTLVNGAWGIMPILLNEYSPPQFRGTFPGTVYQLGNMISAPAAQAQTAVASGWIKNGKPNYSTTMVIFECVIFTICIVVCACGPERVGSHFEVVARAGTLNKADMKAAELEDVEKTSKATHIAETVHD